MLKKDQLINRLNGTANEARHHTVAEMWRSRAHEALPERVGKTALATVLKHERVRNMMYRRFARRFEVDDCIGAGFEQLVGLKDGRVNKFLFATIALDDTATESMATDLQAQSDVYSREVGDHWLETGFRVRRLEGGVTVVVAEQDHLHRASFYTDAREITPDSTTASLAEGFERVHVEAGSLPDLLGKANIADDPDHGLCVVDTIPVMPEKFGDFSRYWHMSRGEAITAELARWRDAA